MIVAASIALISKPAHGDGTTKGISEAEAKGVCADWQKTVASNPGKSLEKIAPRSFVFPPTTTDDPANTLISHCTSGKPSIGVVNSICIALEGGVVGVASKTYFQQKQWSAGTKNACDSLCDYSFQNCDETAPIKAGSAPVLAQPQVKREVDVSGISKLTNGLAFYGLITAVGGVFISAALWAIGANGQNHGAELTGKNGMIVCLSAAFLLGFAPAWLQWLDDRAKSPSLDPYGATSGQNTVPVVGVEDPNK